MILLRGSLGSGNFCGNTESRCSKFFRGNLDHQIHPEYLIDQPYMGRLTFEDSKKAGIRLLLVAANPSVFPRLYRLSDCLIQKSLSRYLSFVSTPKPSITQATVAFAICLGEVYFSVLSRELPFHEFLRAGSHH